MLNYEGLTVRELKRIVNRGEATPAEIGLFVVYDMLERESGRRAIVDNKLLRYIEEKWQFREYANELDYWIELGKQLETLQLRASTAVLELEKRITQGVVITLEAHKSVLARYFLTLYKQARDAGLATPWTEDVIADIQKDAGYVHDSPAARLLSVELEAYAEMLRAYSTIMGDAERLLGVLGLSLEDVIEDTLNDVATLRKEHEERLPQIGQYDPDIAKDLGQLTSFSDKPSRLTLDHWEETIGAFLSPRWREWAQAGIKLRELASSSRGIADLLRHAELAAAELSHE